MLQSNTAMDFTKQSCLFKSITNLPLQSRYMFFKDVCAVVKAFTFNGTIQVHVGHKESTTVTDKRPIQEVPHTTHCAMIPVENAMGFFFKKTKDIHPHVATDKLFILHCVDGAHSEGLSKDELKGGLSIITGSMSVMSRGLIEK
eukprot:2666776-Ditylum_brightwellii.AAC.1